MDDWNVGVMEERSFRQQSFGHSIVIYSESLLYKNSHYYKYNNSL